MPVENYDIKLMMLRSTACLFRKDFIRTPLATFPSSLIEMKWKKTFSIVIRINIEPMTFHALCVNSSGWSYLASTLIASYFSPYQREIPSYIGTIFFGITVSLLKRSISDTSPLYLLVIGLVS